MANLSFADDFKDRLVKEYSDFAGNGASTAISLDTRKSALEKFRQFGFPTPKNEYWKYTKMNFLNKVDFKLPERKSSENLSISDIENFFIADISNRLVFVNGYYSDALSSIDLKDGKITVGDITRHKEDAENYLGKYEDYRKNPFAALNTAFSLSGAFIDIKPGSEIKPPLHLIFINDTSDNSYIANLRNVINVGEGSRVSIIESYHTIGSNDGLMNIMTEAHLSRDASLDYHFLQDDTEHSHIISTFQGYQKKNSELTTHTMNLSGKFIRHNLNSKLMEEHSRSNYYGFYILQDDEFADNHTVVEHSVPDCDSNENYRGVIDDKSTAVFNGRILVQKDAQRTNAYQSNKNILLSDGATINTKPELEIYADDVKCSHGATAGYLDKGALFYFKSRGIDEDKAKAMLLKAFVTEVINLIKIEPLKEKAELLVTEKLDI